MTAPDSIFSVLVSPNGLLEYFPKGSEFPFHSRDVHMLMGVCFQVGSSSRRDENIYAYKLYLALGYPRLPCDSMTGKILFATSAGGDVLSGEHVAVVKTTLTEVVLEAKSCSEQWLDAFYEIPRRTGDIFVDGYTYRKVCCPDHKQKDFNALGRMGNQVFMIYDKEFQQIVRKCGTQLLEVKRGLFVSPYVQWEVGSGDDRVCGMTRMILHGTSLTLQTL